MKYTEKLNEGIRIGREEGRKAERLDAIRRLMKKYSKEEILEMQHSN